MNHYWIIYSFLLVIIHALGILNAAHAVMNGRTSQGSIAWVISLVTFPWIAVPLYWIIGRHKFHGYAELHRLAYIKYKDLVVHVYHAIVKFEAEPQSQIASLQKYALILTGLPFTSGNLTQLLINGERTFRAILDAIHSAKDYILIQFYIVNDDEIGNEFKEALIAKAQQGVRVYFIYDEIGSNKLPKTYITQLRQSGVRITAFHTTKGRGNRFQINFRNHRKIVVVDGKIAFLGGLNIGDEYLGKNPRLSPWRDTHMMLQGPAVLCVQVSFLRDWYWAVRRLPEVYWEVKAVPEKNETVFVLPTGPADIFKVCSIFFVSLINQACNRLWIASPYFVPDETTLMALQNAALRGVDVRIILPDRPDHLMVYLCSFSYYAEMQAAGIKLYRYKAGFMHQKVTLLDNILASVGTVNFDNRSFYLNFEITAFVTDSSFVSSVEKMLQEDFAASYCVELSAYEKKPFWFKLVVRLTRLMAPLL